MAKYGIKVGKDDKGTDTLNILDKLLDNDFPFLKAFKQGSMSVNVTTAGNYPATYTHGLGYAPFFVHYTAPDPNNPTRKYMGRFGASGPNGDIGIDSYIDDEKLVISWLDNSVLGVIPYPYTVTFYYYIFYDKIA